MSFLLVLALVVLGGDPTRPLHPEGARATVEPRVRVEVRVVVDPRIAADAQVGTDGSIQGQIVDAGGGEPVPGALVRVTGTSLDRVVITGRDGVFTFGAVPFGEYRVQVAHPGYAPLLMRVVLRSEGQLALLVPLAVRPIALDPIQVQADRDWLPPVMRAVNPEIAAASLPGHIPALAPQIAAALAHRSAADAIRDPAADRAEERRTHVLYIWGSSAERGRVQIDGATLNAPMHLGGLLPPVDTERLADAELRTGGISPRFDGGTTYIMDFVTRPGEGGRARVGGEVDPLTTRLAFESSLGSSTALAVTARRVNSEAVDLLVSESFGYSYGDILGRIDHRLSGGSRLHGTVVRTQEAILLPRDQGEDEASWRNLAGTVAWRGNDSDVQRSATATFSRGSAELPLLTASGGRTESGVDRLSALWEERRGLLGGRLTLGMEAERVAFTRRSSAIAQVPPGDPGVAQGPGIRSCAEDLPCLRASATQLAAFGEFGGQLTPTSSARAGVRVAWRPANGDFDLLPRVSVTRLLGARTGLTLAAGRFSQTYATIVPAGTANLRPGGVSYQAVADVAHATHLEINVDRQFGQFGVTTSLFLHRHEADAEGPGRTAPGLDLSWGYQGDIISGSVGYSYLGVGWGEGSHLTGLRNRHIAAVDTGVRVGDITMQLAGAWGHGLPLTSIALEHPGEPSGLEVSRNATTLSAGTDRSTPGDRPYLRLDAAASAEWVVHLRGRTFAVAPYVKLLNALSRRDGLFYLQDEAGGGQPRPLANLPSIPVLGVRWAF